MDQILASMIRSTTPVLLAALGGVISERVGVFNIALEGMMLFGAFFAIFGSYLFGSAVLGTLLAVLVCGLVGYLFVRLVEGLRAEPTIAGIGVNTLALGMTTYLMAIAFGDGGSVSAGDRIVGFQPVQIPIIKDIPFLNTVLNGHTPFVYITFLLVPAVAFVFYKTHVGIHLRAVGEYGQAAESAGIPVGRYRTVALVVTGVLCGMAGAHLSLGYVTLFSEGMTNGRGFFAYAAVVFGKADPVSVMVAALIFGLTDTLAITAQGKGISSSLVLMLPYIVTVLALIVRSNRFLPGLRLKAVRQVAVHPKLE